MKSEKRTENGDNGRQTGFIVAIVSLIFMSAGFLLAINLNDVVDRSTKAKVQFVSFGGMSVAGATGRLVISFDLAVAPSNLASVNKAKALLETRFKAALSSLNPNSFYSRAGKEWLASHMRMVANQEIGSELIDAVYFGDFKIFGSKPGASTS